MLFEEIKAQTENVLAPILPILDKKSELFIFTKRISRSWKTIEEDVLGSGKVGIVKNLRLKIEKFISETIGKSDIGTIFLQLDTLVKIDKYLYNIKKQSLIDHSDFFMMSETARMLWEALNRRLAHTRKDSVDLEIINCCQHVHNLLNQFILYIKILSEAEDLLTPPEKLGKQEASLTLSLSSETRTLKEFNLRLSSLQAIYTEACLLLGVNELKYPLRISKVESGSMLGKIFGESKVIEFISWFLKNSIRYLHRRFTLEGKFQKIPTNIKELDAQLGLYAKLKIILPEPQFRVLLDKHADTLIKTAVLIAKHTQKLIERETKIKVDDEVIELQPVDATKYLKAAQKQLPGFVVSADTPITTTPSGKKPKARKKAKKKVKKKKSDN